MTSKAQEWRDSLKVGDKVVICERNDFLSAVTRLTKTLIIARGDRRFRRSDGHEQGFENFGGSLLIEPTLRQRNLASYLIRFDWRAMPLETLLAIYRHPTLVEDRESKERAARKPQEEKDDNQIDSA